MCHIIKKIKKYNNALVEGHGSNPDLALKVPLTLHCADIDLLVRRMQSCANQLRISTNGKYN